jgi:hypothetical protein
MRHLSELYLLMLQLWECTTHFPVVLCEHSCLLQQGQQSSRNMTRGPSSSLRH